MSIKKFVDKREIKMPITHFDFTFIYKSFLKNIQFYVL